MEHPAIATILATRLIAVLRADDYPAPARLARALLAGGISVMEFTFTGANVVAAIAAVRRELGDAACVGAGTVLQPAEAEAALAAGAQFLVTPVVRPAVMAICQSHGTPGICGAFTATEALAAHEAGAALIKIFPARLGGPTHIRDLLGPLPQLRFVPTGGVTLENAPAYLAAGAVAVGMGGNLISATMIARGEWEQISAAARAAVIAIQ
jgi:2-dehydro-3-deoxyphosphogluconate aldolase/(4S)-4-hydroxy-2-oxoglutarate aldolase